MAAGGPQEPFEGQVLAGRWRLETPLGSGAFGAVWRARDLTNPDEERVAVKLLHRSHAENSKILGRFVQEAQIQSRLAHPAIVAVIAWQDAPQAFLVMPFIDGDSLHERCGQRAADREHLPLRTVSWLAESLCSAVHAAHEAGIVHRDLKPKNILVSRRGQRPYVKVLDFGVAKVLEGGQLPATTVGRVMGSVLYLSPEQVVGGGAPGPAVDQFALASILYECLTLRRAWARGSDGHPLAFDVPVGSSGDNNQMTILKRIARGGPPRVRAYRSDAGFQVEAVLHRALSRQPEGRFPTVAEFGRKVKAALVEAAALGGSTPKFEPNIEDTSTTVPDGMKLDLTVAEGPLRTSEDSPDTE